MSWDSEEEHDARERRIGALTERERIKKAQAGALRNLRVLFAPECECAEYNGGSSGHGEDCPARQFGRELRRLRAATKPEGRR